MSAKEFDWSQGSRVEIIGNPELIAVHVTAKYFVAIRQRGEEGELDSEIVVDSRRVQALIDTLVTVSSGILWRERVRKFERDEAKKSGATEED
jgi:hypothetical protein